MTARFGTGAEHRTHAEYQSVIKDVVVESDYLDT
ncbi:MAG: hypothetical protein K0R13_3605 [Propionibacteriaceae bacterium]|jgi:hypothetical protein|nr:hypothetical protein [Propionibacteriaceae bacterium]